MAGAAFTITVDDAAVRKRLTDLLSRVQDTKPAFREIGEVLVSSTKDRFGAEAGPDGRRWAENSPTTIERFAQRHGGSAAGKRVLTDWGPLGDTIHYTLATSGRGVAIGSALKYAAMQQFGGTRDRWPHLWGDIPARPFLGVSGGDLDDILAILRRYISASG